MTREGCSTNNSTSELLFEGIAEWIKFWMLQDSPGFLSAPRNRYMSYSLNLDCEAKIK